MKHYLNSLFFGECRNCTLSLQVLKLMSGVWASCCMHYCVAICHLMMIILTVSIGRSWWVLFHLADRKFLVYVFLGLEILASLLAVFNYCVVWFFSVSSDDHLLLNRLSLFVIISLSHFMHITVTGH